MTAALVHVGEVALEVIEATLPVLALIFFFQFVVLRRPPENLRTIVVGIAMAMVGFFLFMLGATISLIPMGISLGAYLADAPVGVVVALAFLIGLVVAGAEPAVRIFAYEVDVVTGGATRARLVVVTIAAAVGVALAVAVVRIGAGWALATVLVPGYALALVLTLLAPRRAIAVAYDAGAVATGPVAVNFVLPLTTGLAIGLWGEEAGLLGFGVVGLIALAPIVAMLLLGIILDRRQSDV
jgi:hypothetical protein